MIRRSLSYDAFFFPLLFLFSRRRLISVNQDLDFKRNRYKTGLAIQTSFAACPPKQIIPRKAREAAFPHYI